MNALLTIIAALAILDLGVVPMLLSHIRQTGGFHYLVSTSHKLAFLLLVFATGFILLGSGTHSLLFQLGFSVTLLFLFNQTFEINDYILKTFEPEKYTLDGMTEEGKQMMGLVFEDMRNQNKKPLGQRVNEMLGNFITNVSQDVSVLFMVVTNDQSAKESFTELHKMMGNDTKFKSMTNGELFFMVKNRILVDVVALVFVAVLALA